MNELQFYYFYYNQQVGIKTEKYLKMTPRIKAVELFRRF